MGFEIKGVRAAMDQFIALGQKAEPAIQKAVKEGAKLLAEKLQENAPVGATGSLQRSIKPGPVQYNAGDGYYAEVKPVGNHPKTGEPLAKIGNVLEYGRSYGETKKAGLAWFEPTVINNEAAVNEKIAAVFKRETEG